MHILLIEDNPGDVRLTQEALKEGGMNHQLKVMPDGEEALRYLRHQEPYADAPRPHLIFLDLNLPKKGGLEVLKEIKSEPGVCMVPVLILTTSEADQDITQSYQLKANAYITKPVDINQFIDVIQSIERFWFQLAVLP